MTKKKRCILRYLNGDVLMDLLRSLKGCNGFQYPKLDTIWVHLAISATGLNILTRSCYGCGSLRFLKRPPLKNLKKQVALGSLVYLVMKRSLIEVISSTKDRTILQIMK